MMCITRCAQHAHTACTNCAATHDTPRPPHPKRRREGMARVCTVAGHLDHPADLRCILGTMLEDPQLESLCDVVLVVGGLRFPAHRAVLAAASRVFKAMFTNRMKEKNAQEIVLSSVDPKSWRMALQYIYTAQVDIDNEETALLLLGSARMYQLETLERFVEKFLISRLKVSNCFELLGHAEQYDLEELQKACKCTMEDRFEAVALSPAFTQCPLELLEELISSGDLVIRSEMYVFEAITRWITSDEKRRIQHLDKLLTNVKLCRLNEAQLKVIGRHVMTQKSAVFRCETVERLLYSSQDVIADNVLSSSCHLKARKRNSKVFSFAYTQRGITIISAADDEEVVRTPWATDDSGRNIWRLKIYPRGYNKAKGQYLSMYVQARSAYRNDKLDLHARFDIFLANRKDSGGSVCFSSQHRFTESSDHWGFHRFLPLSQLLEASAGFLDVQTDSVLLGYNIYFS